MAHEELNDETTSPQSSKHVGIIAELSIDLLEQMSDGFVAIDKDGICVYANQKALSLLDIESIDQLVGKDAATIFPNVSEHPLYHTARQAWLNHEMVDIEGYFDPWDRWYQLRIFPYAGGIKVFFNEISEKKMQSDLDENERRFSTIFHLSPIATALTRANNSHFVEVNDAMQMLTGYSQEEMIGQSSLDLNLYVKPAVRQALADRIAEAGSYNSVEIQLRQKSGEIRDVIISSEMMEFGSEMYVIAMANDITERKQTEEALRKSEEKFRGIYEQSPIAIQIYDGDGKLIDVNQQTLDMYGVDDKKYLLGYDMWSSPHLTPEKTEALKQGRAIFIPASLDFERIKEMNLFPTNRSGIIQMEMYAIPFVREGDMSGYLVQIVDVTERKQAERDLIESEKRYRMLFENMNAGFVLFEVVAGDDGVPVDLIIRAANSGFEQTTGLTGEAYIDKALTQVLPGIEEDTADWIGTYGTIALTGESRQFVQGSELLGYSYSVSAFPALPNQCAVTFIDITQRKQAEEALKISEQRFRTLIEKSSDILLLIDANREILYASPAVETILGYTPEEFSRRDRFALVHADDLDDLMAQVRWSMDHPGEVIEGEHRMQHKDGSWRTFRRILRNLLHDPAIHALVSNLSDIIRSTNRQKKPSVKAKRNTVLLLITPPMVFLYPMQKVTISRLIVAAVIY